MSAWWCSGLIPPGLELPQGPTPAPHSLGRWGKCLVKTSRDHLAGFCPGHTAGWAPDPPALSLRSAEVPGPAGAQTHLGTPRCFPSLSSSFPLCSAGQSPCTTSKFPAEILRTRTPSSPLPDPAARGQRSLGRGTGWGLAPGCWITQPQAQGTQPGILHSNVPTPLPKR